MDWGAAVGAFGSVAGSLGGVIEAFDGTSHTKAEAALTLAKAQQDSVTAQREANLLAAKNQQQMMLYGLVAVGVVVSGFLVYKAVG